jgi:ESCRT-I complex subunit VPS28
MEEVREFSSSAERKNVEELGTLFTIIRVTEALEAAYSRDAVTPEKYSEECRKLISQFKSTESALISSGAIQSAQDFIDTHQISCPRATETLIKYGVPSTVIHSTHDDSGTAYLSAQATQAFITLMDAIRLEQRAVDDIKPLIIALCSALGKVPSLPAHFEGSVKMTLWLQKLNQMRAVDEITEDDARQLLMELDSSYAAFVEVLAGSR